MLTNGSSIFPVVKAKHPESTSKSCQSHLQKINKIQSFLANSTIIFQVKLPLGIGWKICNSSKQSQPLPVLLDCPPSLRSFPKPKSNHITSLAKDLQYCSTSPREKSYKVLHTHVCNFVSGLLSLAPFALSSPVPRPPCSPPRGLGSFSLKTFILADASAWEASPPRRYMAAFSLRSHLWWGPPRLLQLKQQDNQSLPPHLSTMPDLDNSSWHSLLPDLMFLLPPFLSASLPPCLPAFLPFFLPLTIICLWKESIEVQKIMPWSMVLWHVGHFELKKNQGLPALLPSSP